MANALNNDPTCTVTSHEAGLAIKRFVQWAAAIEWPDIPAPARRRTVRVLADDLAAAFSAADEPQIARARQRMLSAASGASARLLVAGGPRVGTLQAAMGNGLAMGWNELDEGYRKAVCHAGLYVLPALLACAEEQNASLGDLLRALVLGYETVARVADAWRFPSLSIHPHALLAPVGAAAGVGFLRRLPVAELLSAIGGAATLGMAGPFNHALEGVLARNVWAAQAAASGLSALEWAHCGIGGRDSSLHDVYALALGARADMAPLAPGAGTGWAVESGYHKVNACCQYAHSAIEAVQALIARHPGLQGGADVADIQVQVHPLGYALDDHDPATTLGAKFSVPHAVAAALVHGDGGVRSFDTASLEDARIARLRAVTRLAPFPGIKPWPHDRPARVILTDRAGSRFEAVCWSAQGGPDHPFSDEVLWNKVEELSATQAPGLLHAMRAIDRLVRAPDGSDPAAMERPWRECLDDILSTPTAAADARDPAARRPPSHSRGD